MALMLTQVELPGGTVVSYLADSKGRRVSKRVDGVKVQGFLYQNALKPVVELDGNNNIVARFVYGSKSHVPDYMLKGGQTYRIISDHLGSVRLVVNSSTGTVAQRLDYDEYGVIINDSHPGFQPFAYAGGLYDVDTGLVRFGARDYDASVGRWLQSDPIGLKGGINTYAYVGGNPISFVDPFGLLRYNAPAPRTVPVAGATGAALQCVETCLQGRTNNPSLDLLITGGAETTGHSRNSHHSRGEACDIAGPNTNDVSTPDVMACATECGFGAGQYEQFPNNPNRDHCHLQLTPGNGVPALPAATGAQ